MKKRQWNFNENTKRFIREHASEYIVCGMAPNLSRRRWGKAYHHPHIPDDHLCWITQYGLTMIVRVEKNCHFRQVYRCCWRMISVRRQFKHNIILTTKVIYDWECPSILQNQNSTEHVPDIALWIPLPSQSLSSSISADLVLLMGLLPDTENCGCACAGNAGNVFPRHRRQAIPTCITARAWRTCRDACRDR